MFSLTTPTASSIRSNKCFDCSRKFCLNSKQWNLKETPGLLLYYQCLKNLENRGTGGFLDPSENICVLCYAKFEKALEKGELPRSTINQFYHKQMTRYTEGQRDINLQLSLQHQEYVARHNESHNVGYIQPSSGIPTYPERHDVSKLPPLRPAQLPLQKDANCQAIMKHMLPSDSIVSVGNIGYASTFAVQQHLSPMDLSHSYPMDNSSYVSSQHTRTEKPTFQFRNVLSPPYPQPLFY